MHVITGSPSGGIWRTVDGGNTWDACYDYHSSMYIQSLEISHADRNKYFAGTSSEILYSEDGGRTWDRVDSGPTGQQVNTITMHPTDENIPTC